MKRLFSFAVVLSFCAFLFLQCAADKTVQTKSQIRNMVDTIGFAHLSWQMDSVIKRIDATQGAILQNIYKSAGIDKNTQWKLCISPNDDYSYVGCLYPAVLAGVKAKTVIIFGVAHKARNLGLEDQIIFDSFPQWHGAYGPIKVSPIRREIINELPEGIYQVNDSMQVLEHSVEALLPFIQHFNRNIEIVSILVPYMSFDTMSKIAVPLANAIEKVVRKRNWQWGKDYAFAISTDAVHYGDEEWGGKNLACYGTDSAGYQKAVAHETEIINNCLVGRLSPEKIRSFTKYTVKEDNYKEYKWTWCGRYSVPFGLLMAYHLQVLLNEELNGIFLGYATSIDHDHIKVDDLKLGVTAPATERHWVGYATVGYK